MSTRAAAGYAPVLYGAHELKEGYRRAMLTALILAVLGHLLIVGSVLLYQSLTPAPIPAEFPPGPKVSDGRVIILAPPPPPSMTSQGLPPSGVPVTLPKLGIIIPTPDLGVIEHRILPTTRDLKILNGPIDLGLMVGTGSGRGNGDVSYHQAPVYHVPATPSELEVETILPVLIYSEEPDYPDLAFLTEVTGSVLIEALVDEKGKVLQARVGQASGTNAGFDTAAVNAALKNRYKPAIQNGRPVATWVAYWVEFKIKR